MGAELEASSLVSALAMLGIAGVAVSLALLPAAIVLRLVSFPVGGVGAAVGSLGALVLGVKLIAMAWAIGARLVEPHRPGAAVAAVD